MRIMDFDLVVIVDGQPLDELLDEQTDQTWVPAPQGKDFRIFINNNSDKRILVVPLIDGLSVMDGKPGSVQSSGYILGAYEGGAIPGWRIDSQTVAAFKFDSVRKGLAFFAKNSSRDIGVIQCAIYSEKVPPKIRPKYVPPKPVPMTHEHSFPDESQSLCDVVVESGCHYRTFEPLFPKNAPPSSSNRGFASLFKSFQIENDEQVAVGFGAATEHVINETHFAKESDNPLCVMSIRYDTQAHLDARGSALVSKVKICEQLLNKGAQTMMEKHFDDAITAFSRVTKIKPDLEIGWESLAMACQLSGNRKGLLPAISALARLKRKDAALWKALGSLYGSSQAWTEAVNAFDRYNELAHDKSDSWNCLGYALAKTGQTDEAWYCCNKAIEMDAQSFNAWDSLGVVHLASGRLEEAEMAFLEATRLKPGFADAWENLYTTYRKMNCHEDADCALITLYDIDSSRARKLQIQSGWQPS
jgi:Flp pilus assembly protein TadD